MDAKQAVLPARFLAYEAVSGGSASRGSIDSTRRDRVVVVVVEREVSARLLAF